MRLLSVLLIITVFSCLLPLPVFAADDGAIGFVRNETVTLADEGAELVKTPFRVENGAVLGTLAVVGAMGLTYVFDNDIRTKLQNSRGKTLDKAADAGSLLGNPFLHLGVAGAVWGGGLLADSPRWRDTGLMMGEAAVLADAASFVLKEAVGRARPLTGSSKGSFRPFQFKSDYDSLPSMHTASSFAMASVISATSENVGVSLLSYAAATFVGFSRMYEDKHWASDVLLGAAIGELSGRVVTRYHAGGGRYALVPAVSADAASLALVGKF